MISCYVFKISTVFPLLFTMATESETQILLTTPSIFGTVHYHIEDGEPTV